MTEEFEHEGTWWLPQRPQQPIHGTLTFTPSQGAILNLEGGFFPRAVGEMKQIVLGISSMGKKITLHDCLLLPVGNEIQLQPSASSFYANLVLVGAHFETPDAIRFRELCVRYSHLDQWARGITGLRPAGDEWGIAYTAVAAVHLADDGDYSVSLNARPHLSSTEREARVTETVDITIRAVEERAFCELEHVMGAITDFLNLGVGKPVYPLAIQGITGGREGRAANGTPRDGAVNIFYQPIGLPMGWRTLTKADMLFTLGDMGHKVRDVLRNWLGGYHRLKKVCDLLFAPWYCPMYIENRFLFTAQAVEVYHRLSRNNLEMPEEDHQKRVNEILGAVPKEHRKWLEGKLQYSNEVTLRRGLKELIEECYAFLGQLLDEASVQKVIDTRNYLTHYAPHREGRAAEELELHHLTEKLRILLEICLLRELGFADDTIQGIVLKNNRYKYELGPS